MRRLVEVLPESLLHSIVNLMVRRVEAAGAVVIVVEAAISLVQFMKALPHRDPRAFVPMRLTLGRFLARGPEFQLASDVLRTAISPNFRALGQLAAVAAIRTDRWAFAALRGQGGRRGGAVTGTPPTTVPVEAATHPGQS